MKSIHPPNPYIEKRVDIPTAKDVNGTPIGPNQMVSRANDREGDTLARGSAERTMMTSRIEQMTRRTAHCFDIFINWWARRDSNPHGLLHMLLRHACMPIPPHSHVINLLAWPGTPPAKQGPRGFSTAGGGRTHTPGGTDF